MMQTDSRIPQRVLMTADTVGGVWTYSLELAAALAAHGVEVALATMGDPVSPTQAQEAAAVPGLELFESHFKLEWMESPWEDVAAAGQWLLGLEQRLRPDVVHLNGYAHGALPWRASRLVVAHSCVLSWWRAVKGVPAPPEWRRYQEAVVAGLQAADLVVAPSRFMLAELERHYGPLRNCRIIANGRDPAWFQTGPKEQLVFAAGRLWDEAKNVRVLAAVAPGLPWPVYVAGEERHPHGPMAQLAHLRPLGRLTRAEMGRWLARASIYAHPARYEPFGLGVLEAALSGCALVLGDIPSLREIWGDAAVFVPPDEPAALQDALLELMHGRERLADMAARAQQAAREFTPARLGTAYLAAYAEVLADYDAREFAAPPPWLDEPDAPVELAPHHERLVTSLTD